MSRGSRLNLERVVVMSLAGPLVVDAIDLFAVFYAGGLSVLT